MLLRLSLILGLGLTSLSAQEAALRPAPPLTFTLPQEGQKTLSQYRGKVVALEFILTTCMHCQAASKVMTKLQNEFGTKDLQVLDLAINGLDEGRDAKAADALVTAFSSTYQVGFPVGWVQREAMPAFMGISVMERSVVPQLVLIDRNGIVHYQTPPMGDEHSMMESTIRERIQELVSMPLTAAKAKPTARKRS